MFEKTFELAVMFTAVDHVTGPVRKMAMQMGLMQKASKDAQAQMAKFKMIALAGAGVTAFGAVLADGLVKSAEAAGRLQTAMMGVKEAMKLNNPEFTKAMNLAQTVGIPTIFSAEDVGGIMQSMATSGLSKQQVLNPDILRQYVNFADVQAQIKKENAPEVVSSAVNMAHDFQLYTTQQIQPFLNQLNGALLHTSDSASEFATTFRYIAGQAKMQKMSSSDTLSATAWLVRMGFGSGRGGTNFADFLQRSIFHSSGKKADDAMVAAGFVKNGRSIFQDKNGAFVGIPKAVQILEDFGNRFHHDAAQMSPLLHSIFGTQGGRVAMMMTSSGAAEQYVNVQKQIGGTASIAKTQTDLNNTWQGKIKQMQTTLQDIQQAFGRSVVPVLFPLIKALDDILGRILVFEQAHPQMMKWIATFTGIAAAVALVLGPMMVLWGLIGWIRASKFDAFILRITGLSKVWAGVQWLVNGAMDANPIALLIIGIAALIAVVVLVIMHWQQVVKWISAAVQWFSHLSTAAKIVVIMLAPFIGIPLLILSNWKPIEGFFVKLWQTIIKWVHDGVSWFDHLGTRMQVLIAVFAPFIGLPLLIINHWKPLEVFFSNLWLHVLKPILDGIGKLGGGVLADVEHFFHIGPGGSDYAQVSPGSSGSGGDTHIHLHPGAIVVQAAPGRETHAGNAVYSALTKQAVTASRSRGVRPATSYSR